MSDVDLLAPPDEAAVDRAIRDFAREVRRVYGSRLKGIYLFGSRARGDHRRDSDADVAIVLADGDWTEWEERRRLAGLEYDVIAATGAEPQGWPVRLSQWNDPASHRNPDLVRAMRRDAQPIGGAA